jgi:hypothetical protein
VDLMQAMQAATEDAPPTVIDVDDLITRERRRSRTIDRALGAAIVAGLLVTVFTVPRYGDDTSTGEGPPAPVAAPGVSATPWPSGRPSRPSPLGTGPLVGASDPADQLPPCQVPTYPGPSGSPVKQSEPPRTPGARSCEVLVPGLGSAVQAALRRELPGVQVTNLDGTPLPAKFRRNWYSPDFYKTELAAGTTGGVMYVEVYPARPGEEAHEEVNPDSVRVFHADGAVVYVSAGRGAPVTKNQMLAIARDPALTVF